MTTLTITPDYVSAKGHAENRDVCCRLSELAASLLSNLVERLGLSPLSDEGAYRLDFADFYLDRRKIPPGEASIVADSFIYGMQCLARDNPEDFIVIKGDGNA